jgi:DNA-binding NtrC family response regulator
LTLTSTDYKVRGFPGREMQDIHTEQEPIGISSAIMKIREDLSCASRSEARVLLSGESGVGTEVIARLIHDRSVRRNGPFVSITCAGVGEDVLQSLLFGHTQGSFSDAHRDVHGWIERSNGGTLCLDDVDELSLPLQDLLGKFLETGEISPVGSESVNRKVDVRIVAATSKDLYGEVLAGRFREDLFYRLNVIHIVVPPLRERKDDVRVLVGEFMRRYSAVHESPEPRLLDETLDALVNYSWPGNVEELKKVVEDIVTAAGSGTVGAAALPAKILAKHP